MDFNFIVTNEYDNHTLREIMKREFKMSNQMIKRVKLYGTLEVNGVHKRVIDPVTTGDKVFASYDDDSGDLKKDVGIKFYYEDEYLAVIEKPAGIVTHPVHGHLDDSLLTLLSDKTLHPVMRLDRETSGLIVIAKNGHVHSTMVSSKIRKKYVAIVYGSYNEESGVINLPIKRRPNSVMIRDVTTPDDPDGYESLTYYKTVYNSPSENISLVEYILGTGRCHQIRVHSTYNHHPLIGDGLYGPNSVDNPSTEYPDSLRLDKVIGRQALHAYSLTFTHPVTGETMHFISDFPEDMLRVFPELDSETANQILGKIDRESGISTGEKS